MSRKSQTDDVFVRFLYAVNLVAGAANLVLSPSQLGSAIVSVSDGFDFFRWKRLRFRLFASTTPSFAGVVSGSPNVPPTIAGDIMQLQAAVTHLGPLETQWSRWVTVPKGVISGPLPWYHTRVGTFSVTEANPCVLVVGGTGTNAINVELEGVLTFKDPIPTSATPVALLYRQKARDEEVRALTQRERDRLLKLLGTAGSP